MTGGPGRNWFEVFLMVMCVGSGTGGLLAPRGTDIAQAFPRWATLAWFGGLVVYGLIAVTGILLHNLNGLQTERSALLGLAGWCFGYTTTATILCLVQDGLSAYGVALVAAFGVLCMSRVWQIRREIRHTIADLRRMGDAIAGPEATP